MKLLFCPQCQDVRKLRKLIVTRCQCGAVAGFYKGDGLHAVVSTEAMVVGLDNRSLARAYMQTSGFLRDVGIVPVDDEGDLRLEAWAISLDSPRIERREEVELTRADYNLSAAEGG